MREKVWVPLTEQIQKAMEVAETSVEAADYLVVRFTEIITQAKLLEKSADMLARVQDYAKYVKFKLNSDAQPWSGEEAKSTDFKNMQANLAKDAVAQFKEAGVEGNLRLDFAVSDKGELIRGYSADDKALSSQAVEQLDKIFNAWLADSGFVTKGSMLYQANDNGQILSDSATSQGNIGTLIKEDFGDYLRDNAIPVSIYQHEYPDKTQEKQAAIVTQAESIAQSVQKEDAEPQIPRTNL